MSPEWVRVIRDRLHDNGIAFHFKLLCATDRHSATFWGCAMTESDMGAALSSPATAGAK